MNLQNKGVPFKDPPTFIQVNSEFRLSVRFIGWVTGRRTTQLLSIGTALLQHCINYYAERTEADANCARGEHRILPVAQWAYSHILLLNQTDISKTVPD